MSDFVAHCSDLLSSVGATTARAMMGGHLVYAGAHPIALVYDERLYLKTDAATQPAFVAAGSVPFTYELRGKPVQMSYWSAPEAALDDPEAMAPWARLAAEAAARAAASRRAAAASRSPRPRAKASTARGATGKGRGTSGTRRRSPGRSRR
jgi:DNA transformation protein and related proteins